MAIPRRDLIDESRSAIYHCMSRTVRQEFLLSRHTSESGPDGAPVVDDHRRDWILSRLELLATAFAIDCFSVAVMSNHFHEAVRNLPELVEHWSDAEVIYRWLLLHRPKTTRKRLGIPADSPPTKVELLRFLANPWEVRRIRARLSSISWYMKELKEPIAKLANREDGCTGAFWEERFKSVRVLDEEGLTAVAAYIDLNPVRAGIVEDPTKARYTSLEARLRRMTQDARNVHRQRGDNPSRSRSERGSDAGSGDRGVADQDGNSAATLTPPSPHSGSSEDAGIDVQRTCLEFWRRLAKAEDADGGVENEAELDAFIAQFDKALFTPALPARREAYGIADTWMAEEASAATGDRDADPADPPESPDAIDSPDAPESTDAPVANDAPRHPPRPVPSLTPLPFTMGAYLRRLRILAELERTGTLHAARQREQHAGDITAVESLASSLTRLSGDSAVKTLGTMLRTTRHLGMAIGAAASVAAEAVRRGRGRIVAINGRDGSPAPNVE